MPANNTESLISKRPNTRPQELSPNVLDPNLRELDARLETISSKIIPASPYILTVPAQPAFSLSSHQTDDFRRRTPFNADEDSLQYLSFLSDWDNGLITPVGDWSNEKGEMVDKTQQKQDTRNSERASKPGAKKISLSAYKGRVTEVNGAAKVNGRTAATEPEPTASRNGASLSQGDSTEKKRPASAMSSSENSAWEVKSANRAPAPKKARVSPLPSVSSPKAATRNNKALLPPPISPTLPPAIEKELARLSRLASPASVKSKQKFEGTSTASSEKQGGLSKDQQSRVSDDHKASEVKREANGKGPVSGTKPASSKDLGQVKASKHLPEPLHNGKLSTGTAAHSRNQDNRDTVTRGNNDLECPQTTSIGKTKSLIIRLRIPRSRRKDYARLVAMTARPKIEATKAGKAPAKEPVMRSVEREGRKMDPERHSHPREAQSSTKSGTKSGKSLKDAARASEKRPRLDEDDEPLESRTKRRKNSLNAEGLSKPTTPSHPAFKSPVLSHHGSAQKARDLTPNPGGRPEDTVRTPQDSIRNGTPIAPSSIDKPSRDTSQASSLGGSLPTAAEEIQVLWREQRRHLSLGRALKHESDALLKDPKNRADATSKHGLAMALESTLCFMLAYALGDEIARLNRRPTDPGSSWGTIYGWTGRVHTATAPHPRLHALSLQLEAVCKTTHWTAEYDQQQQQQSTSNGGGSSSGVENQNAAATVATAARAKRRWDEARQLFINAAVELAPDELALAFPQTWRARAPVPLACVVPRAPSVPLAGDYFLPLTSLSTPLESVRAVRSMLGEWCRAEGVEWEPKIGL